MSSQFDPRFPEDVEAALASAGLLAAAGDTAFVVARGFSRGGVQAHSWRIVWANRMAAGVLGVGDGDADPTPADLTELSRICLTGADAGARQMLRLTERMRAGAPPVDLRLRLRIGDRSEMVSFTCQRLAGPWLVIVPWGGARFRTEVVTAETDQSMAAANPAAPAVEPESEPEKAIAGSHDPAPLIDRRGNVRFLWRTDRNGFLASITGALCEAVGCRPADLLGRDFRSTIAGIIIDPGRKLHDALGRQDTWSGVEVLWPMRDRARSAPIVFGALPCFDRERNFDGLSGFGVIHLDRVVATPVVETEPAPPAPVPAPAETRVAAGADLSSILASEDGEHDALDQDIPDEEPAHVLNSVSADIAEASASAQTDDGALDAARNVEAPDEDEDENARQRATNHTDEVEADDELSEDAVIEDKAAQDKTLEDDGVVDEAAERIRAEEEPELPFGANVVPIRAWQREPRAPMGVSEAPTFVKPASDSAPKSEPTAPRTGASTDKPAASAEDMTRETLASLSPAERNAFKEIARALSARNAETSSSRQPETPRQPEAKGAADETREPLAERPDETPANETLAEASTTPAVEASTPAAPLIDAPPVSTPAAASPAGQSKDMIALVERLDAGILVSRGGVPAYVNKTLLDMLGYGGIDAFYNAGGVERMFRGRDPDALSRDADGGAIPVIASNGDVLALDGRVQRIEWDGEPATLMTFRRAQTQELTARIRALELDVRQREAEARETHAILDTATDGVVLVDGDGCILSLNKSGQALFGYDQNEVAGEPFTVLLAPESQAPALDYLNGLKSNGVKSLLNDGREISGRARQGGMIPLFMTIGEVGASQPQRFCAVLRDLTQWKKVERELSEARKEAERTSALKSDFLAKVSHEIRTPLNAILGFAEVIMDERFGPVGNQRYKDYLKDIHSSGTHVLSLVNDLLDLSKIESGKMDLNFGAVNANKIVNECVSLLQTQATRERVIVRVSLAPRLPSVVADERSLRQIVLNILSNAVKFNEPGGQVIVSTALTDAGQAIIRIRDTGIGMNEKELEMALEPFRQVATSRPTTGTGLGLPLTKALVEANRAAFTIRSRKGEGTMVEVTFPQTRVLAE